MWLHRRSEDPSKTEISCYWAKSKLSKVGTSIKHLTLKDFGAEDSLSSDDDSNNFLQDVIKIGIENNSDSQLLKHFKSEDISTSLGIHQLMLKLLSSGQASSTASDFISFCSSVITEEQCSEAAEKTINQSESFCAHCKKSDGVFVQQVLGVSKFKATAAMNRGKKLEASVIKELQIHFKMNFKQTGLLQLNPKYPIFGASADAICDEYLVEIKCPQNEL